MIMATENENLENNEAAGGMAALGALQEDGGAVAEAAAPAEPQIDSLGRSYATGRRKDASARVWVKRGTGRINVNGKDVSEYFARPVLQMLLRQPLKPQAVMMNLMSSPRSRAAGFPVRPVLSVMASAMP